MYIAYPPLEQPKKSIPDSGLLHRRKEETLELVMTGSHENYYRDLKNL
jgi:hypothetical protein